MPLPETARVNLSEPPGAYQNTVKLTDRLVHKFTPDTDLSGLRATRRQ